MENTERGPNGGGAEVAEAAAKPKTEAQTLGEFLRKPGVQDALRSIAPKHLTPERIVNVSLAAAERQHKLYKCTPRSLLKAIMTASQLGLEVGGPMQEAHLVPFFNKHTGKHECNLVVGYQGFLTLARRSGEIARVEARVVRKGDELSVDLGTDPKIAHRPMLAESEDIGEAGNVAVYAVAWFKDGGVQFDVMSHAEVEKIRGRSKAGDDGPWVTDWDEMARKTVVRRLYKYLPKSADIQLAIELNDRSETGQSVQDILAPKFDAEVREIAEGEPPAPNRTQMLSRKLAKARTVAVDERSSVDEGPPVAGPPAEKAARPLSEPALESERRVFVEWAGTCGVTPEQLDGMARSRWHVTFAQLDGQQLDVLRGVIDEQGT